MYGDAVTWNSRQKRHLLHLANETLPAMAARMITCVLSYTDTNDKPIWSGFPTAINLP